MWKKIYIKNDLEDNLKLSLKTMPYKNLKNMESIKTKCNNALNRIITFELLFGNDYCTKDVMVGNSHCNANDMELENFRYDQNEWGIDQLENENVKDIQQQQIETTNLIKYQLSQNKEKFEENLKNNLQYFFSASQVRRKGNVQTFNLHEMLTNICKETWEDLENIKHQAAWSFSNFILHLQNTQLPLIQRAPFSSFVFA